MPGYDGAATGKQGFVHQWMRGQARPVAGAVADAEIGAAVVEAAQRDFGIDGDPHPRMQRGEAWQPRHQPGVGEGVQGGQAHALVVAAGSLQAAHDALHVGERIARGIRQLPAFRGERHPACVALEQDDAEPGLELAHVVADRAGGEVQFLAGVGEIVVAGGGFERRQRRQEVCAQGHG